MYFGSEIVSVSKIEECNDDEELIFTGQHTDGVFQKSIGTPCNKDTESSGYMKTMEKLWAFLTIEKLLEKALDHGPEEASRTRAKEQEALSLALKYNFVTPVSSMLVAKSNQFKSSLKSVDSLPETDDDYRDTGFHSGGYDYYGNTDYMSHYHSGSTKAFKRRVSSTSGKHSQNNVISNDCQIELFSKPQLRGESMVLTSGKH